MTTMAWGARVSAAFRRKVIEISADLGVDPSDLMACMAFETGETFSPSIRNRVSGATGLIQFMPRTARAMGTTTDALAALSAEAQLDWVRQYFSPWGHRLRGIEDLYMAILWPRAVGKPLAYVMFRDGQAAYAQNKGLDANRDGQVTKGEACMRVLAKRAKGLSLTHRG